MILHDGGQVVTAEKINTIVQAAGVEVQPFWPNLFEKILSVKNLDDLLLSAGSGGGGGGSDAGSAPAADAGKKAPEAAKPVEEEKKESSEAGMEFDLFG
uniref:60S acidic ribosomal protein P1 n=1 Tax=Arcella intermedia TaxID=1963864 RepID=A0A6B2LTM3_9EUKA